MSKYLEIILIALLLGLVNYQLGRRIEYIDTISAKDAGALFIDTCPNGDLSIYSSNGTSVLSVENFDSQIDEVFRKWEPSNRIILYCPQFPHTASLKIYKKLTNEFGLKNVCILE